ncbi:MAG: hypothetical protein RR232_07365 [Clostridia bacterium]
MDAVVTSKRARTVILIIAAGLFAAAVIWGLSVSGESELDKLATKLNAFGYSLYGDDLFVVGETKDTSISGLLANVDMTEAVEASRAAGFPSDVTANGDILLMLAELPERDVMTLYLRNGEIEMCFIQNLATQQVRSILKREKTG